MSTSVASSAALRGRPRVEPSSAAPGGIPAPGRWRSYRHLGSLLWAAIAAVIAVSFAALVEAAPTNLIYGIDLDNRLWYADPVAQVSGTVMQTGFTGVSNALAQDPENDTLFAVDGTSNDLYWWKPGQPSFTLLATSSGYASGTAVHGASFYDNAYWFFIGDSNELRKLSITYSGGVPSVSGTATYTAIGAPVTGNQGGDIAITPAGTLYSYTNQVLGDFYSINLNTIGSGTVGGYTAISTTSGTGLQLAFNSDYTVLYGHNFQDGNWYVVDTSNGALGSPIYATVAFDGSGFTDLAGPVIAVPEPNTLVLAALGGGGLCWQASRRRRRRGGGTDDPPHDEPDTVTAGDGIPA
jgi:hypothetical protein